MRSSISAITASQVKFNGVGNSCSGNARRKPRGGCSTDPRELILALVRYWELHAVQSALKSGSWLLVGLEINRRESSLISPNVIRAAALLVSLLWHSQPCTISEAFSLCISIAGKSLGNLSFVSSYHPKFSPPMHPHLSLPASFQHPPPHALTRARRGMGCLCTAKNTIISSA